jgi:4-amino-4-deoxy-L-arabinose transferase-like glycosyltransferase
MSILEGHGRTNWFMAVLVTLSSALLYYLTAARDIVVGDTPELITAAVTLGVAHPPGYPLFTMLGHVFSWLPFGAIPFRLNLLSVVCDSLAVGFVYLIAVRLTRSQIAAAVAAIALAANPVFWEWSLVAEVFPLNNLLAAILILLLVSWHEQPNRTRFLIAAFFVAGLALTNHQTIVLLTPAFCFLLWQHRKILPERPRVLLLGLVAFAIGLLPYAYVLWAASHHPAYNWGNVSSFHDLIGLVTRRSYGSTRLVSTPGYTGGPPWPRLVALFASFGLFSGLLICVGSIEAYRSRRWYFCFSLIAFLFAGPFFVWITNLNLQSAPSALFVLQRFFLLSHVVLAPLIAFGVIIIAKTIERLFSSRLAFSLALVAVACAVAVVTIVAKNYHRLDQSRNFIARQFAEDVFAQARPNSILLVSGDGFAFPLFYLQKVEHVGTDITLVALPTLLGEWYAQQLREQHPDLVIPFDRYDRATKNLKALVEANSGRTIAFAGTLGDDHSLDLDYWPYQQGLLTVVMPKSEDRPLETTLAENEELLRHCHPPAPGTARMNTFEADIVSLYMFPPLRLGDMCARAGLKNEARAWYQRALAINPQFPQAREAIEQLEH